MTGKTELTGDWQKFWQEKEVGKQISVGSWINGEWNGVVEKWGSKVNRVALTGEM